MSGTVIMLKGENGKQLIERVKERIAGMHLPAGVKIVPFYDQSFVIDGTIHTVEKNLFEGFILVTILLLVFLGNIRAAIITALVIPLSMLISFLGMRVFGISANLMSLGAIDFGMIVDGAVVMMENSVHRLEEKHGEEPPLESVRLAAKEVVRPMTFAVVIIIAVYLPILFLQGLEGRMFRPMAITVCTALFGSLLLALTFVPVLASITFARGVPRKVADRHEQWLVALQARYARVLTWALDHRVVTLGSAVAVLAVAVGSLFFIGTEFMPRLDEGDILVETKKLPGVSLTDSVEISKRIEQRLRTFPEIEDVVIKIGRPGLRHRGDGHQRGRHLSDAEADGRVDAVPQQGRIDRGAGQGPVGFPGVAFSFTQPMAMRMDETVSGVKADLAVKIFGDDFRTLDALGQQVLRSVARVQGAADAQMEITSGVAELSVKVAPRRARALRLERLRRRGGRGRRRVRDVISEVVDGQKRYTVALRLPDRYRTDADAMRAILLRAPAGEAGRARAGRRHQRDARPGEDRTRRGAAARRRDVERARARPRQLRRRGARANRAGCDAAARLLHRVRRPVREPAACDPAPDADRADRHRRHLRAAVHHVQLDRPGAAGDRQHSVRAGRRHRGALAARHEPEPVGVGRIHRAVRRRDAQRRRARELDQPVARRRQPAPTTPCSRGATRRLRPVLMTAAVAGFGFIPMAVATSTGAEVQRPLASVVIGGLISSTVLTLILLPVLYEWAEKEEVLPPDRLLVGGGALWFGPPPGGVFGLPCRRPPPGGEGRGGVNRIRCARSRRPFTPRGVSSSPSTGRMSSGRRDASART